MHQLPVFSGQRSDIHLETLLNLVRMCKLNTVV